MSRSGDEMIMELSKLMKKEVVKSASKKVEKVEKKKVQPKKTVAPKQTKALQVIKSLHKLATELDNAGNIKAATLVDQALEVIVNGLKKQAFESEAPFGDGEEQDLPDLDDPDFPFEWGEGDEFKVRFEEEEMDDDDEGEPITDPDDLDPDLEVLPELGDEDFPSVLSEEDLRGLGI